MERKLKIYVFGNEDQESDRVAIQIANELKDQYPQVDFIKIAPNQNLPFDNGEDIILIDTVKGLKEVKLIPNADISKVHLSTLNSVHDFDLGFQLKYLKKLGKIGPITIIGLPMGIPVDYSSVHSIVRKLVAQDIQGS